MKKSLYIFFAILAINLITACNNGTLLIAESNRATPITMQLICPDVEGGKLQVIDGYNKYSVKVKTMPDNVKVDYTFSSNNPKIQFTDSKQGFFIVEKDAYAQKAELKVIMTDNIGEPKIATCDVETLPVPQDKNIPTSKIQVFNRLGKDITNNKDLAYGIKYTNTENLTLALTPSDTTDDISWTIEGNTNIKVKKDTLEIEVLPHETKEKAIITIVTKDKYSHVINKAAKIYIVPEDNTFVDKIITNKSLEIAVNEEQNLNIAAVTFPATAFNTKLNWDAESIKAVEALGLKFSLDASDPDNQSGTLTGKSSQKGASAQLIINSADGNASETINISIVSKPNPVDAVEILQTQAEVNKHKLYNNAKDLGFYDASLDKATYLTLTAKIPSQSLEPKNKTILWKSDNTNNLIVAGLDTDATTWESEGRVIALQTGCANITAYAQSNPNTALDTRNVCVETGKHVTGLKDVSFAKINYDAQGEPINENPVFSSDNKFILYDAKDKGEVILNVEVEPSDAANKNIEWQTLNPEVVKLTPLENGKVKVTPIDQGGRALIMALPQDTSQVASEGVSGFKGKRATLRTASMDFQAVKIGEISAGDYTELSNKKFEAFRTELMFNLWEEVYNFAIGYYDGEEHATRLDGGVVYKFKSSGDKGEDVATGDNTANPVTSLTWYDAVAAANALSEYYNHNKGLTDTNKLSCFYLQNGDCYRNSYNDLGSSQKPITQNPTTKNKGFKLPTRTEWEFVARLTNKAEQSMALNQLIDKGYTSAISECTGEYAINATPYCLQSEKLPSGVNAKQMLEALNIYKMLSNTNPDEIALKNLAAKTVAWFNDNSESTTHPAASLKPNSLGIYDMSGNASELIYDEVLASDANNATAGIFNTQHAGGKFKHNFEQIAIDAINALDITDITYGNGVKNPQQKIGVRFFRDLDAD